MRKYLITALLLLFVATKAHTQRLNYAELVNRSSVPMFFLDEIMLPGESDSTTHLSFIFRMNNDFLSYKKIGTENYLNAPAGAEFYTTVRLSTEITKIEDSKSGSPNILPAARDVWQDTLFTTNYDDTQSKEIGTSGFMSSNLASGKYRYLLQLSILGAVNERNSNRQNITVKDFSKDESGEIYLLGDEINEDSLELPLLNLGDNVLYGKDFYALIYLPNHTPTNTYTLEVAKAEVSRKETKTGEVVHSSNLEPGNIYENAHVTIYNEKKPGLQIQDGAGKHNYALVKIPNSTFENAVYQISVKVNDGDEPIAKRIVSSYWPDMPPSLLNLDMSIEMLKFIVSDDELKRLKKGNNKEKETNFRKFWADKDPTPGTEFNELMTEYYRRIDYAFKEFRNPENPDGYDTDRGGIYIRFGPPSSTERQFPDKGKVLEVWKYPTRTFIFEKGTGFSDFRLIKQE